VVRDGGWEQVTDEVVGAVVAAVRPARPAGHGSAWQRLLAEQKQISDWVGHGLTVVKIGTLLGRRGVVVPYRTLHRFCVRCCGYGRATHTVRVADGEPGAECQVDFGKMGLLYDPAAGRRRPVHALIFTAVHSRHMFVWLTFSQTLEAVIAGCEAAWAGQLGPDETLPNARVLPGIGGSRRSSFLGADSFDRRIAVRDPEAIAICRMLRADTAIAPA
jgi:hypothetical protein